jgi:tetratricopeptide (TPR) repeat protein
MFRLLIGLLLFALISSPASAQICGRSDGPPTDMQVQLSIEAPDDNPDGAPAATAGGNIAGDVSHRSGGTSGKNNQEFTPNLQIRVQLLDAYGSNLQESPPNTEGKVVFRVCSRLRYRLRVTGADLEETTTDNLDPGRGDRIVNLALHHKRTRRSEPKHGGMVDASRLKIPRNAQKELDKGNAALASGNSIAARQNFEKAIELYPEFDQAYNNLGVILMQSGDNEAGKKAFEKAIDINDHFARAYVNLAKLAISEKDYSKASDLAGKALRTEPLNPGALFVAVEASYFSGRFNDTIAYTKTLHSLPHEKFGLAHFLSGKSLQSQNLPAEAIAEYELFLKEDPKDPNVPMATQAITQLRASTQ